MSKLVEFRRAEQALREQMALLERLKSDSRLQRDIEFEDKLKSLMAEYGVDLVGLIEIVDPHRLSGRSAEPAAASKRKPREVKVYVNPLTGERIETKGANHALLKAWKSEHGAEVVEGWRQA